MKESSEIKVNDMWVKKNTTGITVRIKMFDDENVCIYDRDRLRILTKPKFKKEYQQKKC